MEKGLIEDNVRLSDETPAGFTTITVIDVSATPLAIVRCQLQAPAGDLQRF